MISNFVSRFSSLSPSRSRSSSISTTSSSGPSSHVASNNIPSLSSSNNRSKSSSSSNSNHIKTKKKDLKKKHLVNKTETSKLLNFACKVSDPKQEYSKAVLQSNFLASINYFESLSKPFESLQLRENREKSPENENATAQSLYHPSINSPTVITTKAKTFFINEPTISKTMEVCIEAGLDILKNL